MVHLDTLRKITINTPLNRGKNAVILSTVHSAKGLEFKNVYIIDLINNVLPTASSVDEFDKGHPMPIEEERRLFYVGMTRAKKNLTLCTLSSRNGEKPNHRVSLPKHVPKFKLQKSFRISQSVKYVIWLFFAYIIY